MNHCGWLTEAGWGRQILMSEDAAQALRGCFEQSTSAITGYAIWSKPMRILQVAHPRIPAVFPPITTVTAVESGSRA